MPFKRKIGTTYKNPKGKKKNWTTKVDHEGKVGLSYAKASAGHI